jgi:hypothetical protein
MIGASRDNTIYQSAVTNSAGGAAGVFVGTNGQGSPRRGLVAFDVAGNVPAGALITGAQLTMYLGAAGNAVGQPIGLHRLTADWGEGTAGSSSPTVSGGGNGFAASPGDATWNARFLGSTSWTNPGATGDFVAVASAVTTVGNAIDAPYSWFASAAMRDDVQTWLDHASSNFGWVLVNQNEAASQTVRAFYSSEATLNSAGDRLDPNWRPVLTVTYLVPEPAAAVLLALVWPLALHRQQR